MTLSWTEVKKVKPGTAIRPRRRTAAGQVVLDFERLDRWINIFLANRFKLVEISHLGVREHGQWEDKNFINYKMPCRDHATRKSIELDLEELKGFDAR